MRLWHKDLISVLPRKQLLSQWRECCAIASRIADQGSPNHMLVNKVVDYPQSHFLCYINAILREMENRNYNVNRKAYERLVKNLDEGKIYFRDEITFSYIIHDIEQMNITFVDWHDERYLVQCFYNLQEKYDCGGITNEEWKKVIQKMEKYNPDLTW